MAKGQGLAKSKLNFDKWDVYSVEKQVKKTKDICKVLQSQKMPPSKYLKKNPDVAPSPTEVVRVCYWVGELEK